MSTTFIAANVIVLIAFAVRTFAGFGGALLCIPLLALFYDLKFVVPVECTFEVILSVVLIPRLFKDISKGNLVLLLSGALVGSAIGIYGLKSFENETLKMFLGFGIILIALNMLRKDTLQSASISKNWGFVVGVFGGILGGLFGTSGPPYVAYLSYRKLEKHVFRATLVVLFAFENIRGASACLSTRVFTP